MWGLRVSLLAAWISCLDAEAAASASGAPGNDSCTAGALCGWARGDAGAFPALSPRRTVLIQREVTHSVRSPASDNRSQSDPDSGAGHGANEPPAEGGAPSDSSGSNDEAGPGSRSDLAAEAEAVLRAGLPAGGNSSGVDPQRFNWSVRATKGTAGALAANATTATAEAEEVLRAAMARSDIPGALNSTRIASAASGHAPGVSDFTVHEADDESLFNLTEDEWKLKCMFATQEIPQCVGRLTPFVAHPHFKKRHSVMVFVMAALVFISLLFHITYDKIIDWLQDNVGHYSVTLAYALFKEIMLLGVIALLLSVTIRSGAAASWSRKLFVDVAEGHVGTANFHGHVEELDLDPLGEHSMHHLGDIREGHCVSELTIIFEDIHMLIFFSCVSLVGITAVNMFHVRKAVALFREAEEAVAYNRGSVGITMSELLDNYDAASGNYFLQLKYWHQMCYLTYRTAFTAPIGGNPARGVRSETFSFLDYTEVCCGQSVVDQVQTPVWCYLTLMAITIVCKPMLKLRGVPAIVTILGVCALLASASAMILMKLLWIERQLVPRPQDIRDKCRDCDRSVDAFAIDRVEMKRLEDIKPYKRLKVVKQRGQSRLGKLLYGTQRPSQREQLFWFHQNGPPFLRICLRLISALVSMLIGAASYHMWCYPYTWFTHFWAIGPYLLLLSANFFCFQHSLTKLVMVTSSEVEPRLDIIDAVNAANRRLAQDKHLSFVAVLKRLAIQRSVRMDGPNGFIRYQRLYSEVTSESDRASIEELVSESPLTYSDFKHAFKSLGEAYRAQAPFLDQYLEAALRPEPQDEDEEDPWSVRSSEVDLTTFQVVVAAANVAENGYFTMHLQDEGKSVLKTFLAALPKKATHPSDMMHHSFSEPYQPDPVDAADDNSDGDDDVFTVFTLEALMERLEYKGSYTKAGMPMHAQAITLLRAANDRFSDGDMGPRKWSCTPKGLIRYLALLDKEVNRPENFQDTEEPASASLSPAVFSRARSTLRSGFLSRDESGHRSMLSRSGSSYVSRHGTDVRLPAPTLQTPTARSSAAAGGTGNAPRDSRGSAD